MISSFEGLSLYYSQISIRWYLKNNSDCFLFTFIAMQQQPTPRKHMITWQLSCQRTCRVFIKVPDENLIIKNFWIKNSLGQIKKMQIFSNFSFCILFITFLIIFFQFNSLLAFIIKQNLLGICNYSVGPLCAAILSFNGAKLEVDFGLNYIKLIKIKVIKWLVATKLQIQLFSERKNINREYFRIFTNFLSIFKFWKNIKSIKMLIYNIKKCLPPLDFFIWLLKLNKLIVFKINIFLR